MEGSGEASPAQRSGIANDYGSTTCELDGWRWMTDDGAPTSCAQEEREGQRRQSTLDNTAAAVAHRRLAGGDFTRAPSVRAGAARVR
jgi:hypothetical protein